MPGSQRYHETEELRKETDMGVNVIFNGYIYHYDDDATFDELLEQTADGVEETERENAVLCDDELD